jgi:dienelactone hydrolase
VKYSNRPERRIDIELPDSKKINGILRGELDNDKPVVILMHGRPGSASEVLQYLGARYLSEYGFNTLRLNMYDFGEHYRDLIDCTLDTHIADFDAVVDFLRGKGVQKIFAVGHSYGGITILGAKAKLDAAVLWDATHGTVFHRTWEHEADYPEKAVDNLLIGTGGPGYISTKRIDNYDQALGDTTAWATGKNYPLKVIAAGANYMVDLEQKYYDAANEPKSFIAIDGATHSFMDSDEILDQLLSETAGWFEKFSQSSKRKAQFPPPPPH